METILCAQGVKRAGRVADSGIQHGSGASVPAHVFALALGFWLVTEIVEGLGAAQRDRVAALRREGRFFWIDVQLGSVSGAGLCEALGIEQPALEAMVRFGDTPVSSRKFYSDSRQVVFAFGCYVESREVAPETRSRLRPVEVHLLVCGEYV